MSKLFGSSGRTYDLKGEVKKLMFEGEIMKPVTSDAGVFTLVMSTFSQYERSVSISHYYLLYFCVFVIFSPKQTQIK